MHLRRSATSSHPPARLTAALLTALSLQWSACAAWAQTQAAPIPTTEPAASPASPPAPPVPPERGPGVVNSELDRNLFYQLLVGEIQIRQGDPGTGYQLYLEAARRTGSSQLYQRAVDIALQARAGEQALVAAQAWRTAFPREREASEYVAQILMALGRAPELVGPLQSIVRLAPDDQRAQIIASLPRTLSRLPDRRAVAEVIDQTTAPWREPAPGMPEAWAAVSEAWLAAGEPDKAHAALLQAHRGNPRLLAVGLLALELMASKPDVERLATEQLQDKPPLVLRLAYARKLATTRRLPEAAEQLDAIVATQPDNAGAWITLGAVRLELKQLDAAEQAVKRYLALQQQTPPVAPGLSVETGLGIQEPEQGYLLMAQIEHGRQRTAAADEWLRRADPEGTKLKVQLGRARLMAESGKLAQARELIRALPEAEPRDAVTKVSAEVQLLRELQRFDEAYQLLQQANERYPDDVDLLYDQAMLAERLKRHEDAEKLLRRVIALKPDHAHAYNALGYSLVERGTRLDEARQLVSRALELRPGDPYITDSLGWLEFRAGRTDDALRWLRQAYVAKADSEIAAHLGEVLWTLGQRDEALRIWREGLAQDAKNETLQETLKRLQVSL